MDKLTIKRELFFTEILNNIGPDNLYAHMSAFGLCDLVYNRARQSGHEIVNQFDTCILLHYEAYAVCAILNDFEPIYADLVELSNRGYSRDHWGSNSKSAECGILTDLRATILCFCAAINDEL